VPPPDPTSKGVTEHSALDLALSHGHTAVQRIFRPSPSDLDVAAHAAALDAATTTQQKGGGGGGGGADGNVAALLTAAAAADIDGAAALLKRDPSLVDASLAAGVTATHLAARGGSAGHVALLRDVLLPRGGSASGRTGRGCTPLALAAEEGCAEAIKLLLDAGAAARSKWARLGGAMAGHHGPLRRQLKA